MISNRIRLLIGGGFLLTLLIIILLSRSNHTKDDDNNTPVVVVNLEDYSKSKSIELIRNKNALMKLGEEGFHQYINIEYYFQEKKYIKGHILENNNDNECLIILFHGAKYSLETWKELDTYNALHEECYVIGLNLPGYGESSKILNTIEKKDYIQQVIKTILTHFKGIQDLILLTPSFSGSYVLPYAVDTFDIKGLITVSPTGLNILQDNVFSNENLKILAIAGEFDKLGVASQTKYFKNYLKIIPKANHACYLDNPSLFHQMIIQFIKDRTFLHL